MDFLREDRDWIGNEFTCRTVFLFAKLILACVENVAERHCLRRSFSFVTGEKYSMSKFIKILRECHINQNVEVNSLLPLTAGS
jgi:hypothetical protein